MALVAAPALTGCQSRDQSVRALESLDDGTLEYCAQATEDGSATFAMSRVHNDSDEAVVTVESSSSSTTSKA